MKQNFCPSPFSLWNLSSFSSSSVHQLFRILLISFLTNFLVQQGKQEKEVEQTGAAGAGGGFGGGGAQTQGTKSLRNSRYFGKGTHSETPSNQTISLNRKLPAFK